LDLAAGSAEETDPKRLRLLSLWQALALLSATQTMADLVDHAEFSFEDSEWGIRLSIERIRAFNLKGIDASSVRGDNDGEVVPDAGPNGIVGGVLC